MDKVIDVSIVVPAFNEEENIQAAIENVVSVLESGVDDYEILVVNDGSHDQTKLLAQQLALENSKIRVLTNESNRGYGYSYRRGIAEATKTYLTTFPGDNDMSAQSMLELIQKVHQADVITSYMLGSEHRPWYRRFISKSFVQCMNLLFGLKLKCYNAAIVTKVEYLRTLNLQASGLVVLAECLLRLIKKGYSYQEFTFTHTGRHKGKSTALSLKNVKETLKIVWILVRDLKINSKI